MSAVPSEPHPSYYMAELGITDTLSMAAVTYLLILQAGFLAAIFRNFFVASQGYELAGRAPRVIGVTGLVLCAIWVGSQVRSMRHRLALRAVQERAATHLLFTPLHQTLVALLARSTVSRRVELFYHTVNGNALHVSEQPHEPDRVVIGLERIDDGSSRPALLEAMLAHEVSHLERRQTRFEIWARFALRVYLQFAGCMLAMIVILAAYLEPEVVDGVSIASIVPQWDPAILVRFALPIALQVEVTGAVAIFGYFILIRRELLHDIRSRQLTGHDALEALRFGPECRMRRAHSWKIRTARSWEDAVGLHPSPCQRVRVLAARDWICLDVFVYPLLAGVIVTMPLLLAGPVSQVFGLADQQLNLLATAAGGLLIYAVARADLGRFAALRIEGKPWKLRMIAYGSCMSAGAMTVGLLLGIRYAVPRVGWLRGVRFVVDNQVPRFVVFTLFFCGLLLALSYSVALIRLCRGCSSSNFLARVIREAALMLLIVLAFAAQSLERGLAALLLSLTLLLAGVAVLGAFFVVASRCETCGTRRARAFALRGRCGFCGQSPKIVPAFHALDASAGA